MYLDNAATTIIDPEVLEVFLEASKTFYANPSSVHSLGRRAFKELEKARSVIAGSINAEPEQIIFTSAATESNNIVFKSLDYDVIITSPTEHASVLEPAKASTKPIEWLDVDQEGVFDLSQIQSILQKHYGKRVLVSLMHANNEIATLADLKAIGEITEKYGAIFHSDIVQTHTKTKIDVSEFNLNLASASAHKIHGPKGIGFLYSNLDLTHPLILGGAQEKGWRAGTQNLPAIIAYARAVEISRKKTTEVQELENFLKEKLLKIPGLIFNGAEKKIPGILNIVLGKSKLNSEELLLRLDLEGVAVSTGSACSSNKTDSEIVSSYVLRACHLPDEIARKAIRISISRFNTKDQLNKFIEIITRINIKDSLQNEVLRSRVHEKR